MTKKPIKYVCARTRYSGGGGLRTFLYVSCVSFCMCGQTLQHNASTDAPVPNFSPSPFPNVYKM